MLDNLTTDQRVEDKLSWFDSIFWTHFSEFLDSFDLLDLFSIEYIKGYKYYSKLHPELVVDPVYFKHPAMHKVAKWCISKEISIGRPK